MKVNKLVSGTINSVGTLKKETMAMLRTVGDMVSVASNLRPDLESEILSIPEIDFRTAVEPVIPHEFVNSHQ